MLYYQFIKDTCKRVTRASNAWEDLANDIYLSMYAKEEDRIEQMHMEDILKGFIFKAVCTQAYGKNSEYTKYYSSSRLAFDTGEISFNVDKISTLNDEELKILAIFVACGSAREVQKQHGIRKDLVNKLINKIKEKL